ncbi:MAG: protoporphyrinogen oxidase HemJ [Cellvibrionaceae bacterium]
MLWIKAFHIIAVVCWFAALFYLPRLFVYHAQCSHDDSIGDERFKVMERKLYRGIAWPSLILTVGLGVWLASFNWDYYITTLWFPIKVTLVAILVIYHCYCGKLLKDFRDNQNTRSHIFYRWFNEVPVLFLIAVVLLAVLKPF